MAQNNRVSTEDPNTMPIMAMAALNGSGDPEALELVKEMLREHKGKRDKEKLKKERQALSSAQAAADSLEAQKHKQSRCSHRKQNNETRLVGQRLSGTRQVCLKCQFCAIEYFAPPMEGQIAPPTHLIPPADEIGSA